MENSIPSSKKNSATIIKQPAYHSKTDNFSIGKLPQMLKGMSNSTNELNKDVGAAVAEDQRVGTKKTVTDSNATCSFFPPAEKFTTKGGKESISNAAQVNTNSQNDYDYEKLSSLNEKEVALANVHLERMREEFFKLYLQKNDIFDNIFSRFGDNEREKIKTINSKLSALSTIIDKADLINDDMNKKGIVFDKKHYPPRRGHHCKIAALALIDAYYSDKHNIKNIPLLSEHKSPDSVRKIAKRFCSMQGEVLRREDLKKIAEYMGYHVIIFNVQNEDDFIEKIDENVGNKLLITFYSSDNLSYNGINLQKYANQRLEHASVISKYDSQKKTITLNHWESRFPAVSVRDLYKSSSFLRETRSQEIYYLRKKNKKYLRNEPQILDLCKLDYKYELLDIMGFENLLRSKMISVDDVINTITPPPDSGFRGIVFALEPNLAHDRWKTSIKHANPSR